jgi:ABC-2 type transport system permease protein
MTMTMTTRDDAPRRSAPLVPAFRMTPKGFRALVSMHARLLLREPGIAVVALLPLALLLIFANIHSARYTPQKTLGGRTVLDVYVPTIAAMVPLMLALTVLPGRMAMLRENKALRRFRVSPVPPAGMLVALLAVIVSLAAAGVAPSQGTANGLGAPMMILNFFFSGLYFPVAEMPHWLQKTGEFIPFGAVMDAWSGEGALWQHLAVLGGYTLLGAAAAVKLFRWE